MLTTILMSMIGAMGLASLAVGTGTPDEDAADPTPPEGVEGQIGLTDGDDWLGTTGDDWMLGARGHDTLDGADGNDSLFGEEGRDLLLGGLGNDMLDGGGWHDVLAGGDGDDSLSGDTGMDTLLGGEGDDTLSGGDWHDLLLGGAGADLLQGDAGKDILIGHTPNLTGTEPDARVYHNSLQALYENADAWNALTPEEQTALAEQVLADLEAQYPGEAAGADGTDTLQGGAGDDTLFLGAGDLGIGGLGHDSFMIGNWVGTGAEIADFTLGEDYLVVEYDASTGAVAPVIDVQTLENGDQVITADGIEVARLIQPIDLATADDVELVGLMGAA
ncbi:calcium-binding protein [Tropicibacter naphthalenivorans]|uniref:Hemolysin, chromosomal n=1 Tax=Tropicibacter naphthalenivorans TaxID=441103 RepID=A0A0N7LZR5_9RHOB|nr:calcium-binding protein [Tropicibacter naphthalenivorans]CUH78401.1 Hemolysin, chromosomal [Tropicibacter naphthalenivorans]SMC80189.1 Hemolysin-type calcium-binding repeat-containing protein [Tropicibacter naphthalenivorans]